MKYRFIEDPGHGWLEVPVHELCDLGIMDLISGYSYTNGAFAYLEEDCDLSVFAVAKGWTPENAYTHWETVYQENTFVRGLPAFPEAENYSYERSYEFRYGKPYEEPEWMRKSKALAAARAAEEAA